jgi:YHS domain-containing protein
MFMRLILEAVVAVLAITLLRSIIGIILKGFSDLVRPAASGPPGGTSRGTGQVPTSDALKKDPVCGTFIAASTSLKKTVNGETYYFCSTECRDKFRAPGVRKAG